MSADRSQKNNNARLNVTNTIREMPYDYIIDDLFRSHTIVSCQGGYIQGRQYREGAPHIK